MSVTPAGRLAMAIALTIPGGAAHGAEASAAPASAAAFDASFAGYETLPATPFPHAGAVDVSAIEHVQPDADDESAPLARGMASYYGHKFHGRRTASGERFNMGAMTAAHRTLPFGARVRVTNPGNGRSVVVRINDRGPFHGGRLIDLSQAAAARLGLIARGSGAVELALLD